jgi:hypothetical protein
MSAATLDKNTFLATPTEQVMNSPKTSCKSNLNKPAIISQSKSSYSNVYKLLKEKGVISIDVEDETEFLGGRSEFQEVVHDTRTTYIEFYDHLGCVGEDSVFITFKAHIVKGEMQDLSVFKIERTNIKEQQEATKKFQERWKKIRSTPEWKLRDFLNNIEWKINRLFYPISRKYSSFKTFLRNKAESKFPDEDISNR